jgi:hypothetical protein
MDMELIKIRQLLFEWERFKQNPNTDFWSKERFQNLLDNEQYVLDYKIVHSDEKAILFKQTNEKEIESKRDILKRLREIYEERFKEELSEDLTFYTNGEKFYLLEQTGFTETENYRLLSETNKCKLLAKVLGCTTETAKKVKNMDHRYTVNEVSKKKIDTFLNSIK